VNEFLWWLKENQEAVQEVAMRKQLKDGKPAMHAGARKALSFAPDSKEDELLLRLLAALRAKPFALDQAVLMKILPRVAGERDYIEQVYGRNENEGLRKALEGKAVSLGKIAEIMKRARDMNAQYITFWP
jgi:hypothetical protein